MSKKPVIPGTFEPGFLPPPLYRRQNLVKIFELEYRKINLPMPANLDVWEMGGVSIVIAREYVGRERDLLWHMSLSCFDRHPSWDEIKTARYRLLPEHLTFGMLLPPPAQYVNLRSQDHVFHLWEITDPRATAITKGD